MSGDPTEEYFAEGLSEELINVLGRVRELKVVARTSSFYFKGKQATIADIARALNVGAVLQGSVRRQAHRVRIGVALSDALTGYQLWSDSFDRNEDDLLTLQGEIATDVSRALQVTLLGEGAADLTLGGTANPRAFDHYLQAIQLRRKNQLRAAVTEFAAAVSTDTGFALARSGLAEAAMRIAWTVGGTPDIDSLVAIARQSAEQGVALAPSIGLVHAVRAQILREADYDLRGAMREASLARSLTPGDASVELIYGQVAGSLGLVRGRCRRLPARRRTRPAAPGGLGLPRFRPDGVAPVRGFDRGLPAQPYRRDGIHSGVHRSHRAEPDFAGKACGGNRRLQGRQHLGRKRMSGFRLSGGRPARRLRTGDRTAAPAVRRQRP